MVSLGVKGYLNYFLGSGFASLMFNEVFQSLAIRNNRMELYLRVNFILLLSSRIYSMLPFLI
jgi:hypothetical protein